ncbi:MAG: CARDB domain-containing protein [Candidatus Bathyarchaeia archaeon]
MLTILLLGALPPAINMAHATTLLISNGTMFGTFEEGGSNSTTFPLTPPTIQDFLINNTATGNTTQFAFYISDSVALQNCAFWNDNGTGGTGANSSLQLSGTGPTYANFTVNPFTATTMLNFTFWLWNTNSSIPPATICYRTLAIYNSSMPYTSLGSAISAVEGTNNWTTANDALGTSGVNPYEGLILNQNTTAQYESVIDSYANGQLGTTISEAYCTNSFMNSSWSNPAQAYDNNTATGASYSQSPASTTTQFGLALSAQVNGTTIQYDVSDSNASAQSSTTMSVSIGNSTTSWTNVANGITVTWSAYANLTFIQSTFTYIEFNFTDSSSTNYGNVYINEAQAFSISHPLVHDYLDVLKYCAYAQKMNLTWSSQHNDLIYALGNITMCGSLPQTDNSAYTQMQAKGYTVPNGDFLVQDAWALYGYYYANNSWVPSSIQSKWNIAAAYNQFDIAANFSVASGYGIGGVGNLNGTGLPLWIFNDSTGMTYTDRYYDEGSETVQDYVTFYSLLNVSDALNKALYWWGYVVDTHWNPLDILSAAPSLTYFRYSNYYDMSSAYSMECEAGFFLKDISILQYYSSNLVNYSYVLADIGTRFLTSEWESGQWTTSPGAPSSYVVVHCDVSNTELRLENTLGAWQALLGCYLQMSSGNQTNMKDMLSGNTTTNIQPAWSLLLNSALWNSSNKQFAFGTSSETFTNSATALGEVTMFQLGIIPGTSTVAFPLEELGYEYTYDIDPVLMGFNLNSTARQITVPVVQAGTITFDYGQSPITHNFTSGGVYVINFTSSWNMISSVTYQSALPSNLIYFYLPGRALSVNISPTSVTLIVGQPQLFTSIISGGTSPYTYQWYSNGSAVQDATSTSWTFTPTSAGPFTVYMEVHDGAGAQATSNTATATVNPGTHDIAVTNVASSKTVVGQGFSVNVTVTVANQGDFTETFNVTGYVNAAIIGSENVTLPAGNSPTVTFTWNTTGLFYGNYTLSAYAEPVLGETNTANNNFTDGVVTVTIPGDVDGNARADVGDVVKILYAFGSTLGQSRYVPNCDIDGNGRINMGDIIIALRNFGKHYP